MFVYINIFFYLCKRITNESKTLFAKIKKII